MRRDASRGFEKRTRLGLAPSIVPRVHDGIHEGLDSKCAHFAGLNGGKAVGQDHQTPGRPELLERADRACGETQTRLMEANDRNPVWN